jgi:hypothetical protein
MTTFSFFLPKKHPIRAQIRFAEGWVLLCLLPIFLTSCQLREEKLSQGRSQIIFAESETAKSLLLQDPQEDYFERVQKTDIGIQLDTCLPESMPREEAVRLLKTSLESDMAPFTEKEINLLRSQLGIIRQWCSDCKSGLMPDTLYLVKVKGSHFGGGTFYTRGKAIVIPEPAIQNPNLAALRRTLLHELFHIYSRYHPQKKKDLYQLIGFEKVADSLSWPRALSERVLMNPDGMDQRFAIQLDETSQYVIPLLLSQDSCFVKGKTGYFAYARLKLVPLTIEKKGLLASPSPEKTLNYPDYPSFLEQVSDNTSYIIHPDEIMADNFALLMISRYEPDRLPDLSLSGTGAQILEKMGKIIE